MQRAIVRLGPEQMSQHCFLAEPDDPNGSAILFTHGYGADATGYYEFAKVCADIGTRCLAIDLLGHGQSGGDRETLRVVDYVSALEKAYDFMATRPGVEADRIGMMAGSFGAYLAVLLSSERPIESLLLRVPALYPDELRDAPRYSFDTDTVLRTEPDPHNEALEIVRRFTGRIILVSSGRDEVIMPSIIEAYDKAIQSGQHIAMPNATHILDRPNREIFKSILLKWAQGL